MARNRLSSHLAFPGNKSYNVDFFPINKKRKKEALVLTLLACIGLMGFVYVFNCMHTSHADNYHLNYKSIAKAMPGNFMHTSATVNLEIKGDFRKSQVLFFEVPNFDQSLKYFINFGDGHQEEVAGQLTKYSYTEQGDYTVSLAAVQNKETVYISKQIRIN